MVERLTDAQIDTALEGLPGWRHEGGELTRQFRFRDFVEALGFIVQLGAIQEQLNHHATITNTWASVTLAVSTHDAGGITERDLALASAVAARFPA